MTPTIEKGPTELISQARQLLNAEYLKKCTDEYKTWAANNPYAINRTGELLLRFPPFTGVLSTPGLFRSAISPPSEKDVVNKALELYNQNRPIESQPVTTPSQSVNPTVEIAAVIPDPVIEEVVDPTPEPEAMLNQPIEPQPQTIEEDPKVTTKDTQYASKIFDIFKVIEKLTPTEDKKEEAIPSMDTIEPVVAESLAADITNEQNIETEEPPPVEPPPVEPPPPLVPPEPIIPIIPLPPMEPMPVPPPAAESTPTTSVPELLTVSPYEDRIKHIFKDIPTEPTPAALPAVPELTQAVPEPLTVSPYEDRISQIFKDVPKQPPSESFTSILKKTFFGTKQNT
jgi:hypothetical protein